MPDTSHGTLYVVATPIGNLDDISSRARDILASVTRIAAEDTRRTAKLLGALAIGTPMFSLHEHNEVDQAERIVAAVAGGESVALVSDAGTPLISDPGYRVVALARARGLRVVAIPGSCAAIAALSVAGLPTDRFRFEGFLPAKTAARRARLVELQAARETLVIYEASHRIAESLADIAERFGPDRLACLFRELTKLHETTYFGSLAEVAAALAADLGGGLGEFTLVVAGAADEPPGNEELARVVRVLAEALPASQAAALAARITGGERRDAYRLALAARGEQAG
ncbi:MAG: 16S rRNA (cytidine(1402)-2'-O)-methyltransferase [Gammaproteobacteria bacterium]|nr:16S rRNA (cytidine(1402)-2'-O)-methyltransferase [Gammaproteobacteria bacterium]